MTELSRFASGYGGPGVGEITGDFEVAGTQAAYMRTNLVPELGIFLCFVKKPFAHEDPMGDVGRHPYPTID